MSARAIVKPNPSPTAPGSPRESACSNALKIRGSASDSTWSGPSVYGIDDMINLITLEHRADRQ